MSFLDHFFKLPIMLLITNLLISFNFASADSNEFGGESPYNSNPIQSLSRLLRVDLQAPTPQWEPLLKERAGKLVNRYEVNWAQNHGLQLLDYLKPKTIFSNHILKDEVAQLISDYPELLKMALQLPNNRENQSFRPVLLGARIFGLQILPYEGDGTGEPGVFASALLTFAPSQTEKIVCVTPVSISILSDADKTDFSVGSFLEAGLCKMKEESFQSSLFFQNRSDLKSTDIKVSENSSSLSCPAEITRFNSNQAMIICTDGDQFERFQAIKARENED